MVHIAADQGATIPLGVSTADALQECLDRAVAYMRFAADKVDSLMVDDLEQGEDDGFFVTRVNAQGGTTIEPNRWYKMEREARLEVERLAAMMTQLGIAERVVRVREAEAALVVAAVREAAIEANIPHDQVRELGAALRRRVENPDAPLRTKVPSYGTAATADATIKDSITVEGSIVDEMDASS